MSVLPNTALLQLYSGFMTITCIKLCYFTTILINLNLPSLNICNIELKIANIHKNYILKRNVKFGLQPFIKKTNHHLKTSLNINETEHMQYTVDSLIS